MLITKCTTLEAPVTSPNEENKFTEKVTNPPSGHPNVDRGHAVTPEEDGPVVNPIREATSLRAKTFKDDWNKPIRDITLRTTDIAKVGYDTASGDTVGSFVEVDTDKTSPIE